MTIAELTRLIKEKALLLGFNDIGITTPQRLEKEKKAFEHYLANNFQGNMSFLKKTVNQREDIKTIFPEAKSILIVVASYYPKTIQQNAQYAISYYTYGNDYHRIIKNKLKELLLYLQQIKPETKGKIFCDTSPIFEKAYASLTGMGWIGKNTLFIHKQLGSFVFLGGIVSNIELTADKPELKSCPPNCRLCINACPINALKEPYVLDASSCLSYLTIEERNEQSVFHNPTPYIAGCDLCQKACPYNSTSHEADNKWFLPNEYVYWDTHQWNTVNPDTFQNTFKNTIFLRIGYPIVKRNMKLATPIKPPISQNK